MFYLEHANLLRMVCSINMSFYFSVKQSGKLKNGATPWPPFRHPAPVSSDYDDPRIVLRSKVFHAMILIILYKAVNGHNISEHVMALAIYLLEMAVITAEPPDKSVSNTSLLKEIFNLLWIIIYFG